MTYKLLLLDLDGTTVASKGDALPSQAVIDAVNSVQGRIMIAVATGRPYDLALPVIQALGLTGPAVFNGGAEIVDMSTGEVMKSESIDVSVLQELVKLAIPFGYPIFSDDSQYAKPLQSEADIKAPAVKLLIEAVEVHKATAMLEQLNGVPTTVAHATSSWSDGDVVDIHITHEHASKRHGAEALIRLLGLERESVIAVGDGHNDIPLLEAAGLKVAMGNAPEEVKAVADYIAPSLANEGVADVIRKYVLVNK